MVSHLRKKHGQTYRDYRTQNGILTKRQQNPAKNTVREKMKQRQQELFQQGLAEGLSPMKCLICGFESMFTLISHISMKHQITTDVYREKFGIEKIQQILPSQRQVIRSIVKEAMNRPDVKERVALKRSFPSEKKHWLNKGFTDDEASKKVSEFQRSMALRADEETRAKLSQKSRGKNNPMSIESIAKRHGVSHEEARLLTPACGRSGELHPMWGKRHTQESLEKIASSRHLTDPTWRSKPEIQLEEWCKSVFGESQVKANTKISRWNIDILIQEKKLIVELFGDFWHMNPDKFLETDVNKITNKVAKEIWQHDLKKLEYLKTNGYNVLVVWERDWKLNQEQTKERIKDAYNRV